MLRISLKEKPGGGAVKDYVIRERKPDCPGEVEVGRVRRDRVTEK